MPEKITFHLGVHKTATTTLQSVLKQSQKELARTGVAYTPLKEMRDNITPLLRSMKRADRKYIRDFVESKKKPTLLWSDETILGWTRDIKTGAPYRYSQMRIDRLCEEFPEIDFEFVLCLRSPVSYWESMYREYIKHTPFETFDDYTSELDLENFSFRGLFSWVYELPANAKVTILPFEKQYGGGAEATLHTLLDKSCKRKHKLDVNQLLSLKKRVSFTQEEIDIVQRVSETAGPVASMRFLSIIEKKNLRFGETPFSAIPEETAEKLEKTYLDDLMRFVADETPSVGLSDGSKAALLQYSASK